MGRRGHKVRSGVMAAILAGLIFLAGCASLEEGRGVWIVRYKLAEPGAPAEITRDAAENNLNTLFVQVYGRADTYYRSEIAPRSEALKNLPADYDPLKEVLELAHSAGLKVHAWMNAYYVWNQPSPRPLSPQHVVNKRPEWLLTDDEGRRVDEYSKEELTRKWIEGLYLDPARSEVRAYLVEISTEIVRNYPVDGIHLDFIRYPGGGFGFNAELRGKFADRRGVEPLLISERARRLSRQGGASEVWLKGDAPLIDRWNHYYYALWNAERAQAISETVRQIYESVKRVRPEVVVSAAVMPDPDRAYYQFSQDWRTWLRQGYLDVVMPMAYHGDVSHVRSQVRAAAAVAGGGRVYAGLGAWIKDPVVISREIDMLREEGIKGFSLFSYGGMTEKDSYLRDLKSGSMAPSLGWPRLSSSGAALAGETMDAGGVAGWLDRRYDWSSISEDEATGMEARVMRKQREKNLEHALSQRAVAAGFRARDGEVSEYMEALAGEFSSREEFDMALSRLKLNPLELRTLLEQEIVLFKYIAANCYQAALPHPEEKLQAPPAADISYILQLFHSKDGADRRETAKKLMEEALQKLRAGEDFAALARAYSQGRNAGDGGAAGTVYYQPGNRISDAIFSLREKEYSGVIEGDSAYYIYRVNSLRPSYQAEYQLLPWEHKRRLFQERLGKSLEDASGKGGCG